MQNITHSPLFSILFLACACLTLPAFAAPPLTDTEILALMKQRIDVDKKGVGMVVGVIDERGSRIISHGYTNMSRQQPVNGDSLFEIGSITKVFTGLLLVDMAEKAEVSLHEPIASYLPSSVSVPRRGDRQITLADLSVHRSGLPRVPPDMVRDGLASPYASFTTERLYQFLSTYQLPREPGSKNEYSNLGVGLLGQVLSLRAGSNYQDLIKQRITIPLDMRSTGISIDEKMRQHLATGHAIKAEIMPAPEWYLGSLEGAGALRSSVHDMLKFLAATMGKTDTPLKHSMEKMQIPFEAGNPILLAWGRHNKKYGGMILTHGGKTAGYNSYIGFDKQAGVGTVVLTNADISVADIGNKIINSAYPLVLHAPPASLVQTLEQQGFAQLLPEYQKLNTADTTFNLSEDVLNTWGYALLEQSRTPAAIEVFKLAVHLYPESANTYDSLAEAYEKSGDVAVAVKNYQLSLKRNPNNQKASKRLLVLGTQ
ncbi:serine hydrolase [Undibacterium sp.]|uniref:serine hydrolase n=1 Tax=Undibacterium sp. TaxID=1914977 RepID=UPI0027311E1B|nr:serine hydrolase [Undibacterium sp.]MDP1976340.1 serine hydrolase [Undibacterium sp.]